MLQRNHPLKYHHRAAGPQLLAECRTLGGCPTGEARLTGGYRLLARFVIHTVGPVYRGRPQDARLLADCYRHSLQLALQHDLRTIAFPAISCGVYGYPIIDAARIALETTAAVLDTTDRLERVVFVLFSAADLETYRRCLADLAAR